MKKLKSLRFKKIKILENFKQLKSLKYKVDGRAPPERMVQNLLVLKMKCAPGFAFQSWLTSNSLV